jgi:hypothetical protein
MIGLLSESKATPEEFVSAAKDKFILPPTIMVRTHKGTLMTIFEFDIPPGAQQIFFSTLQIVVAVIGERLVREVRRRDNVLRHTPAIVAALIATYFTWQKINSAESSSAYGSLLTFGSFTIVWGVLFHLVARDEGYKITTKLGGSGWVKGIDYLYLSMSFTGVVRVLLGVIDSEANQDLKPVNIATVLVIAIGVALRMTKTTIEIWEWDKRPEDRARNRRAVIDHPMG